MAIYTVRLDCGTIRKVVSKKTLYPGCMICIDWDNQITKLSGVIEEIISIDKERKTSEKKQR